MSNPSLDRIARAITQKHFPCSMAVGKTLKHPDGRMVKVKSGQFLDPVYRRLSNWWTWQEVKADGTLGVEESGYGW